jgi:hypothetical protein
MVRAFFHERLCALDQEMCSSANAVNLIRRASRVLAIAGDLVELVKRRETARLVETSDGGFKVADLVFIARGHRPAISGGHGTRRSSRPGSRTPSRMPTTR